MAVVSSREVYTPREIAIAAGVFEADVLAALADSRAAFIGHDDAVRIGRSLVGTATHRRLFSVVQPAGRRARQPAISAPLAVSGIIHLACLAALVWLSGVHLAPSVVDITTKSLPPPTVQLVFLSLPGPGGGGGGGGNHDRRDPPEARRAGKEAIRSPLPRRRPPEIAEPEVPMPKPEPPLKAEPLPAIVAPVVAAGADARDRTGTIERSTTSADSRGPGTGGGAGSGSGTGLGAGDGTGIGSGSGGGTGGGPYRPGSGIEPPRLVREIKADYTEEARRRNIEGEVVLEIVVRRDGQVGLVKLLRGLGSGLDDRAIQAVRQWQFAPATRLGAPVDVMVEVAVEFRLR
jgi:TonB family protein